MIRAFILSVLLVLSCGMFARNGTDTLSRKAGRVVAAAAVDTSLVGDVPPFQEMPEGEDVQVVSAGGACIPVRGLGKDNLAFQDGEHLMYSIHYTWGIVDSDVGTASVDLETVSLNGESVYHLSVYGKTIRWYEKLFKVVEDFQSWFTMDEVKPLKFTRDTQEGKYKAQNEFHYIWDEAEPYIDVYAANTRHEGKNLTVPLDRCTFDLPSLLFFARNMDFDAITLNEHYPMTFAIDDDVYDVYFVMLGREKKKVKGLGTVNTVKFGAKLIAGTVFTGKEDLLIWVSDDDNRIPVYFEAPIQVGFASGRLYEYSGLKNEFTSMVKKK